MDPVVINENKCIEGCNNCVISCGEEVFAMGPQKAYVSDGNACLGKSLCDLYCIQSCEQNAITINKP